MRHKAETSKNWAARSILIVENMVKLAGFIIAVLPTARAGPIFKMAVARGKFQGDISPIIP